MANYKDPMLLLAYDKFVGKEILSFHEVGWDSHNNGLKCAADRWWIASSAKGKYGKIAGGVKNIGCFIDWLQQKGSWCYNPIDMEDYVWSPSNNAYMRKDYPFLDVPIVNGGHYVFKRTDCRSGELIELVHKLQFLTGDVSVWKKVEGTQHGNC